MAVLRKRVLAAGGGLLPVGGGDGKFRFISQDPGLVRSYRRTLAHERQKSVSDILVSIHSMVRIQSYVRITIFLQPKCKFLVLAPPLAAGGGSNFMYFRSCFVHLGVDTVRDQYEKLRKIGFLGMETGPESRK